MPVKLTFRTITGTDTNKEYTVIFKQGDDLRQDQLVIQMFRLMDTLFKKDQLDLKLTPYAVLSTGVNEGFVQFVKARPLREVINTYKRYNTDSIKEAMKEARPDANGPLGIEADVVDNYVRSLAGYCVMCYVLGVGDRHLDNLLLCENGRLFHVDFGFILGRDPKPLPPPMKLT
ncbi:phosphatidylinositol 3- and 4-kinase, partial [Ancylostoma duodenale]